MPAIDFHTHAFPDDIALRAMEKLRGMVQWEMPEAWAPAGDGTVAGLLQSMDKADVDMAVVCPIATRSGQAGGILKWCRKVQSERLDCFPSIHPDDPNPAKLLKKVVKAGFAGIKLHPMYQGFEVDDPKMTHIFAAAAADGLLVALHCGRDFAFPPEDDRASPERIARVIERHSDLQLICTHLGGWQAWDAVEKHLLGSHVYMETSFSLAALPTDRARDIIHRHGVEKVLFGTDWPWNDQARELQRIRELGLSREQTQAILYRNAWRLLGM
jgi:hypothetical protein